MSGSWPMATWPSGTDGPASLVDDGAGVERRDFGAFGAQRRQTVLLIGECGEMALYNIKQALAERKRSLNLLQDCTITSVLILQYEIYARKY